jgi:hypothetical protein
MAVVIWFADPIWNPICPCRAAQNRYVGARIVTKMLLSTSPDWVLAIARLVLG